ncbi:SGNH/GDSL hydrolase family protein [Flavobacterium sp.]|uniref:SGNH/GDSL hydrolase family protein n=1 Tax=Flavobacterium sp. TaxID=239 RepID=UPI003751FA5D
MKKNIKWLLLVSLSFVACNNDDETVAETPVTAGSANFSKYVALGDSFAAGYSDGALFKKGQDNAYPSVLALQFKQAGGGDFTTPYMEDNLGGFSSGGNQVPQFPRRSYFNGAAPATVSGTSATVLGSHVSGTASYNNMGVPGARSYHLLAPGYGNPSGLVTSPPTANPYFVRFASSNSTSILADALTQQPTFFSLWIGGNDVLGYATSGGDDSSPITPATGVPGVGFDGSYNALVAQLSTGGRKGVVANLPYINTLPFFTTVGYNPATLDATQAGQLNAGYAPYNAGLVNAKNAGFITEAERVRRTINFVAGKNAVVMVDEYLTNLAGAGLPSYRQTTVDDFIVLVSQGVSAKAHLTAGNGTAVPLQDRWVVSKDEVALLKTATDSYNITIEAAATANGLAFVNAKAIMDQLVNGGIRFGNYHMSATYVTGGAFSLDGIHPSARGYALIANKFLEAINAKYGSTLRPVDLGNYQIQYPASL